MIPRQQGNGRNGAALNNKSLFPSANQPRIAGMNSVIEHGLAVPLITLRSRAVWLIAPALAFTAAFSQAADQIRTATFSCAPKVLRTTNGERWVVTAQLDSDGLSNVVVGAFAASIQRQCSRRQEGVRVRDSATQSR
jgi:hypothetical protein